MMEKESTGAPGNTAAGRRMGWKMPRSLRSRTPASSRRNDGGRGRVAAVSPWRAPSENPFCNPKPRRASP